jgi:hypothetical protein
VYLYTFRHALFLSSKRFGNCPHPEKITLENNKTKRIKDEKMCDGRFPCFARIGKLG